MYSSIYRVQSSTRRHPIRALFGFTLKLVESYLSPSPQSLCVVVCPWCQPWVASDHQAQYIAQQGDAKAWSQILHNCQDQILKTPQANHPNIALPDSIHAVST